MIQVEKSNPQREEVERALVEDDIVKSFGLEIIQNIKQQLHLTAESPHELVCQTHMTFFQNSLNLLSDSMENARERMYHNL